MTRIFIAFPTVIFASCLAAASADPSNARASAGLDGPSNFDYLVLASIADSPQFLTMAGYRPAAGTAQRTPAIYYPSSSLRTAIAD